MNGLIVLIGMKHCGKTTIARLLAESLGLHRYDLDEEIQNSQTSQSGARSSIREIYSRLGAQGFRTLEEKCSRELITRIAGKTSAGAPAASVVALGGGMADNPAALALWKLAGLLIMLEAGEALLFERIERGGLPPFLQGSDPRAAFHELYERRSAVYRSVAELRVDVDGLRPRQAAEKVREALALNDSRRSK